MFLRFNHVTCKYQELLLGSSKLGCIFWSKSGYHSCIWAYWAVSVSEIPRPRLLLLMHWAKYVDILILTPDDQSVKLHVHVEHLLYFRHGGGYMSMTQFLSRGSGKIIVELRYMHTHTHIHPTISVCAASSNGVLLGFRRRIILGCSDWLGRFLVGGRI